MAESEAKVGGVAAAAVAAVQAQLDDLRARVERLESPSPVAEQVDAHAEAWRQAPCRHCGQPAGKHSSAWRLCPDGDQHYGDEHFEAAPAVDWKARAEAAERMLLDAYRREPTQSEGDAHEHEHHESMGPARKAGECFVPMGGWTGRRCRLCNRWTWGGPTACAVCVERERADAAERHIAELYRFVASVDELADYNRDGSSRRAGHPSACLCVYCTARNLLDRHAREGAQELEAAFIDTSDALAAAPEPAEAAADRVREDAEALLRVLRAEGATMSLAAIDAVAALAESLADVRPSAAAAPAPHARNESKLRSAAQAVVDDWRSEGFDLTGNAQVAAFRRLERLGHLVVALREALAAQPASEPVAQAGACTCGSGAHPRRCALHPEHFDLHCAQLNVEGYLEDSKEAGEAMARLEQATAAALRARSPAPDAAAELERAADAVRKTRDTREAQAEDYLRHNGSHLPIPLSAHIAGELLVIERDLRARAKAIREGGHG